MLSRQRTRPVTCSTRSLRIVAGSCTGRAVTFATTRHNQRRDRGSRQRLGHRVSGGLHQRRMERRGDVERDRARALFLGVRQSRIDASLRAGDDDVADIVVVGHDNDASARARLRRSPRPAPHRPCRSTPPSRLRRPAPPPAWRCRASRSSRAASATRERASRGERRIFAKRMASDKRRPSRPRRQTRAPAPASPPGSPPSARAARWRSASVRRPGPSKISRDSFSPKRLIDLLEHLPARAESVEKTLAHAGRLASLSGENEGCASWGAA